MVKDTQARIVKIEQALQVYRVKVKQHKQVQIVSVVITLLIKVALQIKVNIQALETLTLIHREAFRVVNNQQ